MTGVGVVLFTGKDCDAREGGTLLEEGGTLVEEGGTLAVAVAAKDCWMALYSVNEKYGPFQTGRAIV